MIIRYAPGFIEKLEKADIRIKKSVKEAILIFSSSPNAPQLHNHALKREYTGYRSIDVTVDYRILYKEIYEGEEVIAYFVTFGTHAELY